MTEPSKTFTTESLRIAREMLVDAKEMQSRIAVLTHDDETPVKAQVFRPDEIYRNTTNIAPDLIVYFENLRWRSMGSVGHQSCIVSENDTGPDGCNHSQLGMFVLSAPTLTFGGECCRSHFTGYLADVTRPSWMRYSACNARSPFGFGRQAQC